MPNIVEQLLLINDFKYGKIISLLKKNVRKNYK